MNTNKISFRSFLCIFIIVSMMTGARSFSQDWTKEEKKNGHLSKTLVFNPSIFAILNINNLWMWERRDGKSNHSAAGKDGILFPRSTAHIIYQDGIVWGARAYVDKNLTQPAPFDQPIRVMGATYGTGCRAGWVEGFGKTANAADINDPRARIYKIRRDWKEVYWDDKNNWTETARQDAADCFEIPIADVSDIELNVIADDYLWCWQNWPVDLGAPFIDRNGNGVYDPPPPFKTDLPKGNPSYFGPADLIKSGYDEPGIAGTNPNFPADMVIWNVYNDLYESKRFGSYQTGMEIQNIVWGYALTGAIGDMYFRKVKFINKGGVAIDENRNKGVFYLDSMYVVQWSDPDVGYAGDDLIGCDTVLNTGFAYNAYAVDINYRDFGLPPPSAGYVFVQGPIIPSPGGVAVYDFKYKQNLKNLGMTSFAYLLRGNPYADPAPLTYKTGALRWYKMMRGYAPLDGPDVHYNFPPGVSPGPFPYSGDPIKRTGYIDGLGDKIGYHGGDYVDEYAFAPGDRQLLCISGPFQMAPGDTQEVVVALVCGLGADGLSSVSVMKYHAKWARSIALGNFDIGAEEPVISPAEPVLQDYRLYQNYPNPIRFSTTIDYDLPVQRYVRLVIYNLLGQEVITLVDEIQNPNSYSYNWDGKNSFMQRVPNGIYLYEVEAGAIILTKKLMIIE